MFVNHWNFASVLRTCNFFVYFLIKSNLSDYIFIDSTASIPQRDFYTFYLPVPLQSDNDYMILKNMFSTITNMII